MFVSGNRVITQPNNLNPQGVCLEWTRALTLYYSISPKFLIKKLNLFFPIAFQKAIFDSVDADDVRDLVCNVMESNCTDTLEFNNMSVEGCKDAYDKLNMTDNGYLDSNTKGCRILHSSFVPKDLGHCPHLSYAPLADEKGKIKCQSSRGQTPSDLFSQQELGIIAMKGEKLGFPTNLTRSCTAKAPTKAPTQAPTKKGKSTKTKATKKPATKSTKTGTSVFN
jgi:hypothetical protein